MSFFRKNRNILLSICIIICLSISWFVYQYLEKRKSCLIESNFCEALSFTSLEDSCVVVHPFITGQEYIVVLPSHWKPQSLLVKYTDPNAKYFILEQQTIGQELKPISVLVSQPYSLSDNKRLVKISPAKTIRFEQSNLNTIFIRTESGNFKSIDSSKDKSWKEKGELIAVTNRGKIDYKGKLSSIHGRGNMSWNGWKKPYSIKIKKDAPIFGLKSAKKFNLLSNDFDESGLRNWIMFHSAEALGMPHAIRSEFASLYRNGHYSGIYQITNKVEVDKSGVDISDLEKETQKVNKEKLENYPKFSVDRGDTLSILKGIEAENNPENITGGYLLDVNFKLHRYAESASGFIPEYGYPREIKAPEYATRQQVDYISSYYKEMMDAIRSKDGVNPSTGKHYSDYINVESFILYYLCSEVFYNLDAVFASFFMIKEKDSKMECGPLWDYDLSMNTKVYFDKANGFNSFYVREAREKDGSLQIFGQLYQHPEYKKKLVSIYNDQFLPILRSYYQGNVLDSIHQVLQHDMDLNYTRWPNNVKKAYAIFQDNTTWNARAQKEYKEIEERGDYWNIKNFLEKRSEWLAEIWKTAEAETKYNSVVWDFGHDEQFQHTSTRIVFGLKENEIFHWPRFFIENPFLKLENVTDQSGTSLQEENQISYYIMNYQKQATKR